MNPPLRFKALLTVMIASAGKLSLFVLISIALLLAVKKITDPMVAEAERQTLLETLNQVMPTNLYDNDPLQDTLWLTDPSTLATLGSETPVLVYRARKNGKPAGLILTTIAPNGYTGNIYMLMSVLANNRVGGVHLLNHKETPGLGDKIELNKNNWILAFNNQTISEQTLQAWAVKKDGGHFDQFTGATITPRAVVGQVKRTLLLVKQQSEFLYE